MTQVRSDDGLLEMYLPAGSLPDAPVISVQPAAEGISLTQDSLVVIGRPYAVRVSSGSGAVSPAAALNLYFEPEMLGGTSPSRLRIYHWDSGAGRWVSDGGSVDVEHQFVSTQVTQLSTFALMAVTRQALERPTFLPIILRAWSR
jgi:hypothetical protein